MRRARVAVCILTACILASTVAYASGFENTGLGTTARGMGGAFRAIANDWTAAYYNPAGYANIIDNQLGGNVGFIHYRNELIPNHGQRDAFNNTYEHGIVNNQSIYNLHAILNNPAGGFAIRMPVWGEMVCGLSAYQPFDYSINWKLYDPNASDFRAYNPMADSLIPIEQYKNDLDVIAFQLTAGREFIEDRLLIGIGLQLLRADLEFTDLVFRDNPRTDPKITHRPYDRVPEFSRNRGKGWGFGLRGGMIWKLTENLNIGVTGYAPFDITVSGSTHFTYIMPYVENEIDLAFRSQEDILFVKGESVDMTSDFEAELRLPPSIAFGVAYDMMDNLTVSVDAEYTFWSRFEGFEFRYMDFEGVPSYVDFETGKKVEIERDFFTADMLSPNDWDNAGKIMLGIRYEPAEVLTLLGGGSADQSPSRLSNSVTPQFVDTGDKYGYHFGAVVHINEWDVGIVTSYIDYPDLVVGQLPDDTGYDLFVNFPGEYKASTYETVLSLTYRF